MFHRFHQADGLPPRIKAPLQVRSCGHYIVGEKFRDNPFRKDFLELFWGIRGTANIGVDGKVLKLRGKTVFYYLPGDFHDIRACEAPLEYCYLTLDGSNLGNLIEQFGIRREIVPADVCPVNLFRELAHHLEESTIRGEYMASTVAYQILTLAAAGVPAETGVFTRFKEKIQARFSDPELTIQGLSDELKIHTSTLNRCLNSISGMSPGEYLLSFRLREASSLITQTELPFKVISSECGFSDPNYFAKTVRRKFGMSPSELRKNRQIK